MQSARQRLLARAVAHTLFSVPALPLALARLPFVQADPIRAPARAQDLILLQRVEGYRVGDLERAYPELDLEEGFLHAYGFMPRAIWQMRHPPNTSRLTALEKKVLARVGALGVAHPEALRAELGRQSSVNGWGGQSSRVKLALESLHRRGLLRVARRERGIRLYAPNPPLAETLGPKEIFESTALTIARVLAPVQERTMRSLIALVRRLSRPAPGIQSAARELSALVTRGVLVREELDGTGYLWPAREHDLLAAKSAAPEAPHRVRFLAPFDPLVWDRKRFEQLWGWAYRFEAYTPVAKRVRGYYAMPLCFGGNVIGWANVSSHGSGRAPRELDVELGFVRSRPRGREFSIELDREVERMRAFLVPPAGAPSEDDPEAVDDGAAQPDPKQAAAPEQAAAPKPPRALRSTAARGSSRPRATRQSQRPPS